MADFTLSRQLADNAMRGGDYELANQHYCAAWENYADQRNAASEAGIVERFDQTNTAKDAFWLLLRAYPKT